MCVLGLPLGHTVTREHLGLVHGAPQKNVSKNDTTQQPTIILTITALFQLLMSEYTIE